METTSDGIEVLDRRQCLALLRRQLFGRVALTVDALPVIVPVDYCVMDDVVLFQPMPGTRLTAATRNAVVAFETDHDDPAEGVRWSVLVVGLARDATDAQLARSAWRDGHAPPWRAVDGHGPVALSLDVVSGSRIALPRYHTADCA